MTLTLRQCAIYVADMDRSVAFYRDILGLRPISVGEWWSDFDAGGAMISLEHPPADGTPAAGRTWLVMTCPDLDRTVGELRRRGLQVPDPHPSEAPEGGLVTVVTDPDGLQICLESNRMTSAAAATSPGST